MVEEKAQEEGTRRDQKTRSDMIFLFTKHNSIHSPASVLVRDSPLLTRMPTYSPLYRLLSELYLALPLF